MGTTAQPSRLGQVLQLLPAAVLNLLDGWSLRIARSRQLQRQQRWLLRQAPPVAAAPQQRYQLRPWRD